MLLQLFCFALFHLPALAIIRVMPLGDSITAAGCWRAVLHQSLDRAGLARSIDLVGSQKSWFSCPGQYDADHEGHSGYEATGIVKQNQLPDWLEKQKPVDIVVMLLGTNDVWRAKKTADIIDAFTTLLGQMRASNPSVKLLVGQITPLKPSGLFFGGGSCSGNCDKDVAALNTAIAAWAPGKSTTSSPVTVVDCSTGFNYTTDTFDGVHPNSGSGTRKMADCWLEPLSNVIRESIK